MKIICRRAFAALALTALPAPSVVPTTPAQRLAAAMAAASDAEAKGDRKALAQAGIEVHYLEYGSYFSQWRKRNALKMWTGWPTFPMVFVHQVLIGGAKDTKALIDSGELKKMV